MGPDIDRYLEFNSKINNYYFGGDFSHQPVYLDFEDDIRSVCSDFFGGKSDTLEKSFGELVRQTLLWQEDNIYRQHLSLCREWQRQTYFDDGPPFTALLLSFSLAAEHMRNDSAFSLNNYYDRLSQVYGGEALAPRDVLSDNGKNTEFFWDALNIWLEENDFSLGNPTAHTLGNKRYVGRALSQSLVRDADRESLQKMIIDAGLQHFGEISASEMEIYLAEWVSSSRANKWLKTLWAIPEIRPRIVSAASDELQDSNFTQNAFNASGQAKKLLWTLDYQRIPKKRVRLRLMQRDPNMVDRGTLQIDDECSDIVRTRLDKVKDLRFKAVMGAQRYVLELPDSVDALLSDVVALKFEGGIKFKKNPRPIIVFLAGHFGASEVHRVLLHEKHFLVVRDGFVDKVRNYLNEYAREGFDYFEGNGRNGLPEGWWCFSGVQVIRVAGTQEDSLVSLIPSSEGDTLHLQGGIRLLGDGYFWNIHSPPEILFSNEKSKGDLLVTKQVGSKAHNISISTSEEYDPRFIKNLIETGEIVEGVYSIAFARSRNLMRRLILRSADTPRKLTQEQIDDQLMLSLVGGDKCALYSGPCSTDELGEAPVLRGCYVMGDPPLVVIPERMSFMSVSFDSDVDDDFDSNLGSVGNSSQFCFSHHTFQCPPQVNPRDEVSRIMTCGGCGLTKLSEKARRGRGRTEVAKPENVKYRVKGTTDESGDQSAIYDSIFWLRRGGWRDLERVTGSLAEEPLKVLKFVSDLVDSGTIDAYYDQDFNRPKRWVVTPTVLMENFDRSEVFLTGFANDSLLDDLGAVMDARFNRANCGASNFALGVHRWKLDGCTTAELSEIVSGMNNSLQEPIFVQQNRALDILSGLISIKNILPTLERMSVPRNPDVKVFDLRKNSWVESDVMEGAAHQLFHWGVHYFYKHIDGEQYGGAYELIKLLAARAHGSRLCEYSSENSRLVFKVGCPAPGLYRRALFALNGTLPYFDTTLNGEVYDRVPESFASLLFFKLYH